MAILEFMFSNVFIFCGMCFVLILVLTVMNDLVRTISDHILRAKELKQELQYLRGHIERIEVENENLRHELSKQK